MKAQMKSNTDKTYFCVQCGSENTSIVREDPTDPRIKCNNCNFMFSGQQSKAAEEAGAIPDEQPVLEDNTTASNAREDRRGNAPKPERAEPSVARTTEIPRTPSYVFLSKDRTRVEFCSKKDLKRTAVKWQYENTPHEVFELLPKKISAKVEIE